MIGLDRRSAPLAALVALLIGAFGLRVYDLGVGSVWHDEAWSIRAIRNPVNTPDDNTPPVYYALLHVLWRGAGESEFALRYGSVLLGLLTVAAAAALAARWAGSQASVLAAGLLAISPLLWAYAREVRAYVAVPLLTLIALWLVERLIGARRFAWRVWAALLITELVLLYTHNLSVPVVAWINLVVGGTWAWQRRWRWLAVWVAGQAALLLAYLPWMMGQSTSGTPLNTPPVLAPGLVWDVWQGYFAPLPAMIGAESALVLGSALFGLAALLSAATLVIANRSRYAMLTLSQAVLLPLLATVLLRSANIDFHPRYYVAAVPATLLVIIFGVESIPLRVELRRLAAAGALALAMGISAVSLLGLLGKPQYQHDDFRAMAQHYAALPAETLIVVPYGWEPALEEYYFPKLGVRALVVGVPLHSDADEAMETINAALVARGSPAPVELLTWYQLPADLRGMYPCLLEAAGRRADRAPITFQALTTTAYEVEQPLTLDEWEAEPAATSELGLSRSRRSGGKSLCVQTEWEGPYPTSEDWRVSARLARADMPGWVLARSDSDIRDEEQRPTSCTAEWVEGHAFSLLPLPPGAPPGEYAVQLIAFSAEHPDGVDWQQGGVSAGRVLTLPSINLSGTTYSPFASPPPVAVGVEVAPGITLEGHDAVADAPLNPGQELRITLWWRVNGDCCGNGPWAGANLVLRGDDWRQVQRVAAYPEASLDWHAFAVPAYAEEWTELVLEPRDADPVLLARYMVEATDRLYVPPSFQHALGAEYTGLAVLEGFDLPERHVPPAQGLDLALVWRVLGTGERSYRVFTHLLDDEGRVIAQHDEFPVSGQRPTTGWLTGEYIVDPYHLEFDPERAGYRGPARVEVGFYDPDTGARVPLAGGGDHVVLPVELRVQ